MSGPLVALGVASLVGLLAPVAHPASAPVGRAEVTHPTSGVATRVLSGDATVVPAPDIDQSAIATLPIDHRSGTSAPGGGSAVAPPAVAEPPAQNASPAAPPIGGGDAGGAPSSTDNFGLTIDPSAGSVTLDGVGSPSADSPPVTIAQVPTAGGVACGQAGLCEPVTITTPVPVP